MQIAKKCVYCGKKFLAKTLKTKYCSHTCNQKHYKAKKKEKNILENSIPPIQNEKIIPFNIQLSKIKYKKYINLKEASLLLGISRTTMWRLLKNNHISSAKVGARVIIRKKDLKKLINNQIDTNYRKNIILNKADKKKNNEYFYMGEIPKYYNISSKTIERHLIKNNVNRIKKGRFVYVLKSDIIKLFGKPQKQK